MYMPSLIEEAILGMDLMSQANLQLYMGGLEVRNKKKYPTISSCQSVSHIVEPILKPFFEKPPIQQNATQQTRLKESSPTVENNLVLSFSPPINTKQLFKTNHIRGPTNSQSTSIDHPITSTQAKRGPHRLSSPERPTPPTEKKLATKKNRTLKVQAMKPKLSPSSAIGPHIRITTNPKHYSNSSGPTDQELQFESILPPEKAKDFHFIASPKNTGTFVGRQESVKHPRNDPSTKEQNLAIPTVFQQPPLAPESQITDPPVLFDPFQDIKLDKSRHHQRMFKVHKPWALS